MSDFFQSLSWFFSLFFNIIFVCLRRGSDRVAFLCTRHQPKLYHHILTHDRILSMCMQQELTKVLIFNEHLDINSNRIKISWNYLFYYMNFRSYSIEMKKQVLVIWKYDRYFFKIKFKSKSVNGLVLSLYTHNISKPI